jgi:hypothetical protein
VAYGYALAAVSGVKTVDVSTGVSRALNALATIWRRNCRSRSGGKLGSPQGWGIETALTIRLAPTCSAIGYIALTTATGTPARSNSLLITAPLRLQVPQVATSKTPSTPSLRRSLAISCPTRRITAGEP